MRIVEDLRALNRDQWASFLASVMGWTLDAFDFFLMVYIIKDIAHEFHEEVVYVTWAVGVTLMLRPFGAFFFGWLADKYGRRPILMLNVLTFSAFELASAFAPNLITLLILRAFFGFAMGGEWGIGSSLVMESIPARSRGTVSGILQQGYPLGNLLAALVFAVLYDHIGWRGMLIVGLAPALLVLYIRMFVKESPVWEQQKVRTARKPIFWRSFLHHWQLFLYVVLLMAAFNIFSHGTHDLYPAFLREQHQYSAALVGTLNAVGNVGAIIGGIIFGAWSQRIGRRKAIIIAALVSLPLMPVWVFATTPLMLGIGAFLVQIGVQGAWGVIPAHLNELSPPDVRATFPSAAYQTGNLIASVNAPLQAWIAMQPGSSYAWGLIIVAVAAALAVILMTALGEEAREVRFEYAE